MNDLAGKSSNRIPFRPIRLAIALACVMVSSTAMATDNFLVGRGPGPNMRFSLHHWTGVVQEQIGPAMGETWGDGRGVSTLASGDLDGNGTVAFAVGRNAGPNMRFRLYRWNQTCNRLDQIGNPQDDGWGEDHGVTALAFGDVDGDGGEELAVGRTAGPNMRFRLYRWNGADLEPLGSGQGTGWSDGRGVSALAFGDIDGNGDQELVVGRDAGPNMRFQLYDWVGADLVPIGSQQGTTWGDDRSVSALAVGDIDGDGDDEIAVGRNAGPNMRFQLYDWVAGDLKALALEEDLDEGETSERGDGWGPDRGVSALAFGDVEGDGREELAVGRNPGKNFRFRLYAWRGGKVESIGAEHGTGWGDSRGVSALAFGNIDASGGDELLVGRNAGPNFRYQLYRWTDRLYRQAEGGARQDLVPIGVQRGVDWGDGHGVSAVVFGKTLGDRDTDGLFDQWETSGIDTDCDGNLELDLASLGADPDRKTVFVEADFMTFHQPSASVINDIQTVFANAPLPNPDGTAGIDMFITVDDLIAHQNVIDAGDDFDSIRSDNFGTAAERAAANSVDVLAAKRQAFRYMIFAHQHDDATNSSSGTARNAFEFIVTLGAPGWAQNAMGTHSVGTRQDQAGTFLHELGHTLALGHGGGDAVNCKPNYLSVMSYHFQVTGMPNVAFPTGRFDYSRQKLHPTSGEIHEGNLSEQLGIGGAGVITVGGGIDSTRWSSDGGVTVSEDAANGMLDWDGDGTTGPGPVAVDINTRTDIGCAGSPGQVLAGYNDWANIVLNFRGTEGYGSGKATDLVEIAELTSEAAKALKQVPKGASCRANSVEAWQKVCSDGQFEFPAETLNCLRNVSSFDGVDSVAAMCKLLNTTTRDDCEESSLELLATALNLCTRNDHQYCPISVQAAPGIQSVGMAFDFLRQAVLEKDQCKLATVVGKHVNSPKRQPQ